MDRLEWSYKTVDMTPHLDTLHRLASGHRVLLDLGVRTGVSAWVLLDAAPEDGEVWSVDNAPHTAPDRVTHDPRWHFVRGDDQAGATWDQLPDRVDFAFIDTSHEYPHTLDELRNVSALRPSTIVLHDWNLHPVQRSAVEFLQRHPEWHIEGIEPSPWGLMWLTR